MSRGARSVAQTKARFTGPPAFPDSLLFSPPGEAKCVRGRSGLSASRAEEKGASRLARAGVLAKSPPSPFGLRNTAFPIHWPSDISSGANQAPSHGFHESRDTKHESRPFIVCFDRRVVGNAGYSTPKPRPTVFHESRVTKHGFFSKHGFFRPGCAAGGSTGNRRPNHCPRRQAAVFLFAIVRHCSPLFTIVRHCSPLFSKKIVLQHAIALAPSGRCFPAAFLLWSGMARLWSGMGGRRPPRRQHGLLGFHQPRITQHGFSLSLQRLQGEQPQARPTGFSRITRHETRITAFMLFSLLSCKLWSGMARLWSGMGGRRPPRRQHGPLGFHQPRDTQHGFSLSLRRLQGEQPQARPTGFSRITSHESRPLYFSSHDFPAFPAIIRPPLPLEPVSARRQPWLPPPSGLLPQRLTPNETMLRKEKNVLSLHVSPRGEAKCVRVPSGLGASRAEEKGASRLARAGVLAKSLPSPLGSRNTAFTVHRPSDISLERTSPPPMVFTNHESRPFFVCFGRRVVRNAGWLR